MAYPTTSYTNASGTPSTTYTTANASVAADGDCDWKQGSDGGQHWIILVTIEPICRIGFDVFRLGPGTSYTATP